MALLPYILSDVSPSRIHDKLFGLDLADNILSDILDRPRIHLRRYLRPRSLRNLTVFPNDVGSSIKTDKDKFQVNLDVQHFDPEEISVKTADGYIVVEGKHEERKDGHGFVSRQFKRRYVLPEDCNVEAVESKLSSDGVLTVTALRSSGVKDERIIPITQTGPVRRKLEEEESKGEAKEEVKTPQKRRKR